MAVKVFTHDDIERLQVISLPKSYKRASNIPLDPTQIFASYEDAVAYAAGTYKHYGNIAYAGQVISVVNSVDSSVTVYKIGINSELIEIGADTNTELDERVEQTIDVVSGIQLVKLTEYTYELQNAKGEKLGNTIEIPSIAKSSDHVFLSRREYDELIENGSVDVSGETIQYSDDVYYCIYQTNDIVIPDDGGDDEEEEDYNIIVNNDNIEFSNNIQTNEENMVVVDSLEINENNFIVLS